MQYPKRAAAVGPFAEGRQDALVLSRTTGCTHQRCHIAEPYKRAEQGMNSEESFQMGGSGGGSLTAVRLCRTIDPCNLVHEILDISDGRVHEGLGRKDHGVHDLAPVGDAPAG